MYDCKTWPYTSGLIDNWLCHIKSVHQKNEDELLAIDKETDRIDRLCELNVIEQVNNICHTTIVQRAWRNNKELSVHGCIYTLETGILKDPNVRYSEIHHTNDIYQLGKAKKEIYKPDLTIVKEVDLLEVL